MVPVTFKPSQKPVLKSVEVMLPAQGRMSSIYWTQQRAGRASMQDEAGSEAVQPQM